MERIEYWGIANKSDWPTRGAWDAEPDKIQWPDDATGLPCLIVRNSSGALCGYVGVPKGHPLHNLDYSQCPQGETCLERTEEKSWCDHTPEHILEAHGGITFAGSCTEITREKWEAWRKRQLARRDEAKRFPRGDAARDLKEWAVALDSFEAWAERAHGRYICHVPTSGDPDDVWWFGFDCAHAGDFCPSFDTSLLGKPTVWGGVDEYRDIGYVAKQCRVLAKQLAEMQPLRP